MKTFFVLCLFILGGCAAPQQPYRNDPHYAPVLQPAMAMPPATAGSLFRDNAGLNLFSDDKAMAVGDLITVVLSEQTISNKSANVEVSKDSEFNMPAPTIFGGAVSWQGRTLEAQMKNERDFTGEADAAQSNSLRGNISVTVDVWPNGTLVIRGEKWMTLNRGDELIRISGLVRPSDVNVDNEVLSTRIANAKITYTGTGELASSQQMGFMSRFFNSSYWPF